MRATKEKPTVETLTDAHETAARKLAEIVQQTYPVGSVIRAKVKGGESPAFIDAEVIGYSWKLTYPHELRVRNTRTGKTRNVSSHPRSWNAVSLVCLPENVKARPSLLGAEG